jgi:hypothetical protein
MQCPLTRGGPGSPGPKPATLRASVGSTEATSDQSASVSSDRRAQRGSRFVGQDEDPNRKRTLFATSVVRFPRGKAHSPGAETRDRRAGLGGPPRVHDKWREAGRSTSLATKSSATLSHQCSGFGLGREANRLCQADFGLYNELAKTRPDLSGNAVAPELSFYGQHQQRRHERDDLIAPERRPG